MWAHVGCGMMASRSKVCRYTLHLQNEGKAVERRRAQRREWVGLEEDIRICSDGVDASGGQA